jgi:hypothetical protein
MAADSRESGAKVVTASDGSTFEILRHAPGAAAEIRGNALVAMREIAGQREPELVGKMSTSSGCSAEYAMGAGIAHSKDPDVKADLVRVAVRASIEEGDRSGAVSWLAYARATQLSLPEFGEAFVEAQYEAALGENSCDAWMIAREMLTDRAKIVRPAEVRPEIEAERRSVWKGREDTAFKAYAEDVLAREKLEVGASGENLLTVYWGMLGRNRKVEEGGAGPDELTVRITQAQVESDLAKGGEYWEREALMNAEEAGMSDAYMAELQKRVNPGAIEKSRRFAERLAIHLGGH